MSVDNKVYSPEEIFYSLLKLPYYLADKHLIPQYWHIKPYIKNFNINIHSINYLTEFFLDRFNENLIEHFSNKTDQKIFNQSNLSKELIEDLKAYYASDFFLLDKIKH